MKVSSVGAPAGLISATQNSIEECKSKDLKATSLSPQVVRSEFVSRAASHSINSVSKVGLAKRAHKVPMMSLSFAGNQNKKTNQFLFIAPENKSIGLNGVYGIGGLGVVTSEAGNNWAKKGADVRIVLPYHSEKNKGGGLKVMTSAPSLDAAGVQKKNDKG